MFLDAGGRQILWPRGSDMKKAPWQASLSQLASDFAVAQQAFWPKASLEVLSV